jgi:hypothetical protein
LEINATTVAVDLAKSVFAGRRRRALEGGGARASVAGEVRRAYVKRNKTIFINILCACAAASEVAWPTIRGTNIAASLTCQRKGFHL